MELTVQRRAEHAGDYDVIVAGGGVAGVAAAVAAKRMGSSVLLIEKTIGLGGLATTGLINCFVPMCNGRGTQIIKGMAEELLRLSIRYGYDTLPEAWRNGEPGGGELSRYSTMFSASIFTLALTEFVKGAGVDILFDTIVTEPVMDGKVCKGLVTENKGGCQFYGAGIVIDTTGDADVLYRAGVPTVQGGNYHTYLTNGVNLDSCRAALESGDIAKAYGWFYQGGTANLYGANHPEGKPLWKGTTAEDVTDYVVENQIECLNKLKESDRKTRTVVTLPGMPQFRTTRHIDGDYTLLAEDAYRHFEDSVAAICDFDRRDYLYEVPYRTLIRSGFPNLIAAGRVASASGYGWDVLRVIPPAILTGQAAGTAASLALRLAEPDVCRVDIRTLQQTLADADVMIHFDDALVPAQERADSDAKIEGHF